MQCVLLSVPQPQTLNCYRSRNRSKTSKSSKASRDVMISAVNASKRQVDDFNTIAQDAALPANALDKDKRRPGSGESIARSDPGVRGVLEQTAQQPELQPLPTSTPASSVIDDDDENVKVDDTEHVAASEPPAEKSTPQKEEDEEETVPVTIESPALPVDDRELLARSQPANTPTTPCTEFSRRHGLSRPSQQTANTTIRRQYFDQAVNLVAARCVTNPPATSNWQRRLRSSGSNADFDPPPGFGGARVFYVRQQRPRPMTPLKAWAGYHGNVYFSPLRISRSEFAHPDSPLSLPSLPACSGRLQRILEPSRLNAEHLLLLRARSDAAAMKRRQPPRRAALVGSGQQPIVQLDREFLASRAASKQQQQRGSDGAGDNATGGSMAVSRDVHLYRSAHATGSLQFHNQQQAPQEPAAQEPQTSAAGRVYRGSVSRKLRDLRLAISTNSSPMQSPTASSQQQQQQQQQFLRQARVLPHNNSMASLDREIERLYDRLPSLMASVPRSQAQLLSGGVQSDR